MKVSFRPQGLNLHLDGSNLTQFIFILHTQLVTQHIFTIINSEIHSTGPCMFLTPKILGLLIKAPG